MKALDLTKYGITGAVEVIHNPSYEELFVAETDPTLEGFEKGVETELGAVNVMTGIYTGRSSLWMKPPRTQFGGHPMNSRTTIIPAPKKHGQFLKTLL